MSHQPPPTQGLLKPARSSRITALPASQDAADASVPAGSLIASAACDWSALPPAAQANKGSPDASAAAAPGTSKHALHALSQHLTQLHATLNSGNWSLPNASAHLSPNATTRNSPSLPTSASSRLHLHTLPFSRPTSAVAPSCSAARPASSSTASSWLHQQAPAANGAAAAGLDVLQHDPLQRNSPASAPRALIAARQPRPPSLSQQVGRKACSGAHACVPPVDEGGEVITSPRGRLTAASAASTASVAAMPTSAPLLCSSREVLVSPRGRALTASAATAAPAATPPPPGQRAASMGGVTVSTAAGPATRSGALTAAMGGGDRVPGVPGSPFRPVSDGCWQGTRGNGPPVAATPPCLLTTIHTVGTVMPTASTTDILETAGVVGLGTVRLTGERGADLLLATTTENGGLGTRRPTGDRAAVAAAPTAEEDSDDELEQHVRMLMARAPNSAGAQGGHVAVEEQQQQQPVSPFEDGGGAAERQLPSAAASPRGSRGSRQRHALLLSAAAANGGAAEGNGGALIRSAPLEAWARATPPPRPPQSHAPAPPAAVIVRPTHLDADGADDWASAPNLADTGQSFVSSSGANVALAALLDAQGGGLVRLGSEGGGLVPAAVAAARAGSFHSYLASPPNSGPAAPGLPRAATEQRARRTLLAATASNDGGSAAAAAALVGQLLASSPSRQRQPHPPSAQLQPRGKLAVPGASGHSSPVLLRRPAGAQSLATSPGKSGAASPLLQRASLLSAVLQQPPRAGSVAAAWPAAPPPGSGGGSAAGEHRAGGLGGRPASASARALGVADEGGRGPSDLGFRMGSEGVCRSSLGALPRASPEDLAALQGLLSRTRQRIQEAQHLA